MNLGYILPLNLNKNVALKSPKQNICYSRNSIRNIDLNNITYPKNYYLNQISFGIQYCANETIDHIGKENFPNQEIVEKLFEIGKSKDYSLYDMHLKHYKDLLDCSTLDEAKELYPEFQDVIDAKDIEISSFDKRSILNKISKGKIEGINIDTLALDILKRHYGKLYSIGVREQYWNLRYGSLIKLMNALNIKPLNRIYMVTAIAHSDEFKSNCSKAQILHWQDPESKEKFHQVVNTPEFKAKKSQNSIRNWQNPEFREKYFKTVHSAEYREKRSQLSIKNWQNPEFREKQTQTRSTDEYKAKQSQIMKKHWQDPNSALNSETHKIALSQSMKKSHKDPNSLFNTEEYRIKRSEISTALWQNIDFIEKQLKARSTEEHKARRSQAIAVLWQDPNSAYNSDKFKEIISKKSKEYWQNPESREKQTQLMQERWQDPEYKEKMSKFFEAQKEAYKRHPEITNMMSEVAKSFPKLREIIRKTKSGIELTEEENMYNLKYFKECARNMPGFQKIIGQEIRKILLEWGLKEE